MILTAEGYSEIRVGSLLKDVRKSYNFTGSPYNSNECGLYSAPEIPGLLLYVENMRITRVSVMPVRLSAYVRVPPLIRTDRGIVIGSTEVEVRAAYPEAIREPWSHGAQQRGRDGRLSYADLYVLGEGRAPALRFLFDSDGRVKEIAAGIAPALLLREGCN